MVIAIDGPAGAGKSTVAKEIARRTGMYYLNSGNFYRAVTWLVIHAQIDPQNREAIIQLAEALRLEIRDGRLFINGIDVEDQLHTDQVDEWVAEHSAISRVREIVNANLKKVSESLNVVVEGRDITTVVFPEAEVKVYLDASLDIRAKRRYTQGLSALSLEDLKQNIIKRDKIDKSKAFGGLKIANDAIYLDTSDLTIDEVCERVIAKIHKIAG
ncbi:MAG: (d)CMP kinase [Spirochaetota bacterium]